MIFGIGKMRPCGHCHVYKYAHCTNATAITNTCRDYKRDLTEDGEFTYRLDNLVSMPTMASLYLKKFVVPTPKLYASQHAFSYCLNLTELSLYTEQKGASGSVIGANIQINDYNIARKFSFNYPKFIGSVYASSQQIVYGHGSEIRAYMPFVNSISLFFEFFGGGNIYYEDSTVDFYAPSVEFANRTFYNNAIEELTYEVYPISGNHVFGEEPTTEDLANVDENGDVIIEKRYSLFPKLSSGENMFWNCQLNKDYILAFAEALPTWTDGKENHLLTLGIHIDHKYDPDVNLALKKLNMDYVTPIEEAGGTLTEEVTSDKGWTTTIQWNGTATSNAYPAPTTTSE